jgi:hypothetical protein
MAAAPPISSGEPRAEYTQRLTARRAASAAQEARHRTLGYIRIGIFLAAGGLAFLAYDQSAFWWWLLLVPMVAVVWLGDRLRSVEDARRRAMRGVTFYERALARLDGRWAGHGESGSRFLDEHHLYARDLDIFGEGSLFQLLSNARTGMGEEVLAAWLTAPAAPDVIGERQRAVVELAPRLELREDLAALGEELLTGIHGEELMAWGEAEPVLRPSPFRTVAWGLSVLGGLAGWALVAYLVSAAGFYDLSPLVMVWLQVYFWITAAAIGAVLWRFRKRTARVIGDLEDSAKDLGLLAEVVRRLEAEQFESPRLARLRAALDVEGQPPSRRIARLNLLTDLADSRHNQLMGIIGPLLLWNVHLAYAIEEWRRVSGPALRRWLTAVAEMEALSSIAGYHYEHPEYVFPEFTAESPLMEGEALGHPLLGEREAVTNDLRIGGDLRVLIVSGSNMSGKSTMLRTAGVNSVLAQAGAPVRARRLRLSPLAIGASIRTQDSLQEGTSRFYAEITRLQQIMEKAAASPPALFLIDEFLHGTNSHDRRIGAEAIVRGLVDRGAIGLVTTHDLALAHIAENLGPRGANVHFEDHLENGRMHFDYKMRPGVVEKSNAIELMRSVGLDV